MGHQVARVTRRTISFSTQYLTLITGLNENEGANKVLKSHEEKNTRYSERVLRSNEVIPLSTSRVCRTDTAREVEVRLFLI